MATLQNTLVSLQSKTLLSRQTPRNHPLSATLSPLNLSFSATFPSLELAGAKTLARSRRGAMMMVSSNAAASYAAALADVGRRNNALDSIAADVEKLDTLFSNPEVFDFFANPVIDVEKKRNLVDEISRSSALQVYSSNFLNILLDAKRMDLINGILKEFEMVYNKMTDTELAVVSSVVKLEPDHLAQIAKQVQRLSGAKNVRIKTVIDPSLLAGFTVRYGTTGSKLIDLSVRKQLQEIASQIDLGDIKLAV